MSPCSVSCRRWYSGFAVRDGPAPHRVAFRDSGGMPNLPDFDPMPTQRRNLLNRGLNPLTRAPANAAMGR